MYFTGDIRDSWELKHVNLVVEKKFRLVFEGLKGAGSSMGGLSLDDINLSETACPQHVWRIRNITGVLATTPVGTKTYSPRFLSPKGYSFQVSAKRNRNHRGANGCYCTYLNILCIYGRISRHGARIAV